MPSTGGLGILGWCIGNTAVPAELLSKDQIGNVPPRDVLPSSQVCQNQKAVEREQAGHLKVAKNPGRYMSIPRFVAVLGSFPKA